MEKPPAFPQPANIVSHSSASMTVYAHSHSAYYGEYPSRPILIEREKREQKKKRERHPRPKPKAALPLCYGKVFKTASLHPSNRRGHRPVLDARRSLQAGRGLHLKENSPATTFSMYSLCSLSNLAIDKSSFLRIPGRPRGRLQPARPHGRGTGSRRDRTRRYRCP